MKTSRKGSESPAPSWDTVDGRCSTSKPAASNQAWKWGTSSWRSGCRNRLGTNRPALTVPALAVKTRSGRPGWGVERLHLGAGGPQVGDQPVPLTRATSTSTFTSRCIHGLIS